MITEADKARWVEGVLVAMLSATNSRGLKVYMSPAMQREVLYAAIEAVCNLEMDAYQSPISALLDDTPYVLRARKS